METLNRAFSELLGRYRDNFWIWMWQRTNQLLPFSFSFFFFYTIDKCSVTSAQPASLPSLPPLHLHDWAHHVESLLRQGIILTWGEQTFSVTYQKHRDSPYCLSLLCLMAAMFNQQHLCPCTFYMQCWTLRKRHGYWRHIGSMEAVNLRDGCALPVYLAQEWQVKHWQIYKPVQGHEAIVKVYLCNHIPLHNIAPWWKIGVNAVKNSQWNK